MMMSSAEDDDDFIVQTVVETGASDTQDDGAFGWTGLKKMFAKGDNASLDQADAAEPEPTLPPGFSAILNAEEEDIYPAEAKIRVLVAEGNLVGRGRRQAAELHQALQQVVGAAAMYNHLLCKHGVVGPTRKGIASDSVHSSSGSSRHGSGGGVGGGAAEGSPCGCGGAVGSCKAISSLLKAELDKVSKAAEADRQGAHLKKLRQVERRSGGLCNPDLLEKVVRSSSNDGSKSPRMSPPQLESPRQSAWGAGGVKTAAIGNNGGMSLVGLGVDRGGGWTGVAGSVSDGSAGGAGSVTEDVPWADDMLCSFSRRRHREMLKKRGRALAKGLARLLRGVSKELQAVASRLPPWEESEEEEVDTVAAVAVGQGEEIPAHGRSISRSSFGSFKSNDSSSFRSIDSLSELFPAKVSPLSTTVNTVGAASNGNSARGDAEDVKTRRQDWKLDANELSLIRREEERVMKPDVLGKLLASGASLGCLQQADFWDVFARLEVATRTEALLNIAIRGGRHCPARSGRMGRELSMSLTSVVLEAINTVEQDTSKYHSMSGHQQRPLQRNDHHDSPRGGGEQKKRPSSERFSRRPHTAESGQHRAVHQQRPRAASGTNARPDTAGNGPPQHRRVARREKVNSPRGGGGGQHKEDEGLADLDMREEEFRKAIYVNRSALANRLLQLTHNAPLCAKVLGTFVNDVGDAGRGIEARLSDAGNFASATSCSSTASGTTGSKPEDRRGSETSGGAPEDEQPGECDRRESNESCGSHPSPPLSMTSTEPLSEGGDDAASWTATTSQPVAGASGANGSSKTASAFRDSRECAVPISRNRSSSSTAPNSPPTF